MSASPAENATRYFASTFCSSSSSRSSASAVPTTSASGVVRTSPLHEPDQHAVLAAGQVLDRRGRAEPRRQQAVEGARRAAALHVTQRRHAQLEAQPPLVLLEVLGQPTAL